MTNTQTPKALIQLLRLALGEWRLFLLSLLALLIASGINLLLPELLRNILNIQEQQSFLTQLRDVSPLLLLLFAIQGFAFYVRSLSSTVLGQRVVQQLRSQVFSSLIHRPLSFFDTQRTGELTSSLLSDTAFVQEALSQKFSIFLRYSIQVVVGLLCMFVLSWQLSLLILISVPPLVGVSLIFIRHLKKHSRAYQERLGESNVIADESLSLLRMVKAFQREAFQQEKYNAKVEEAYTAGVQRGHVAAIFSSLVSFLLNLAIVGILWFGLHLLDVGELARGDLAAFLLYGVIVSVSFAFLSGSISEIAQALGATERLFSWLAAHPIPSPSKTQALETAALPIQDSRQQDSQQSEAARPLLEFRSVDFSYPSRAENQVLSNVSFVMHQGEHLALVGKSGSGKTSIVSALLGLYPIQAGKILFCGKTLSSLSEAELRSAIALVPQDAELFGDSIYENIRFGRLDASREDIECAAKKAGIHEFVASLPEGYNTRVGDRGKQLSGGQRQRIAIARAIVRNPLLLILDEATSALDGLHEIAIRDAIRNLGSHIAVLIIAHRLASFQDADRVIVLQDGHIVEQGAHHELLRKGGSYQALVEAQSA